MLKLPVGTTRDCELLNRRQFLEIGGLSAFALTLPEWLRAQAQGGRDRKTVSCILMWMQGGPSHIDTFDPKPEAPPRFVANLAWWIRPSPV
jgi:uncharacterized protein (DUF1501 family)